MKTCTQCQQSLGLDQFNKRARAKDGYANECKQCHRVRTRQWYRDNSEVVHARRKRQYDAIQAKIQEYKVETGCAFCDETYHRCLQFHHTDPSVKEYNLSDVATKGYTWNKAMNEIKKCIVVCGNCHVKVHDGLL